MNGKFSATGGTPNIPALAFSPKRDIAGRLLQGIKWHNCDLQRGRLHGLLSGGGRPHLNGPKCGKAACGSAVAMSSFGEWAVRGVSVLRDQPLQFLELWANRVLEPPISALPGLALVQSHISVIKYR